MAAPQSPNEPEAAPAPWPNEEDWINYTVGGDPVTDWEDKPYENDPTHGIANVQPAAVDIASGVDATGGGAQHNPGNYTSVQYLYRDTGSNSSGCDNLDDDWLFLRMRVADDPTHGGKFYYKAYHWDVLVDTDGDVWSEFVVDLNGGDGFYKFGTVGVYYSNDENYEYDPENDARWLAEASSASNDYTRAVFIDYDNADPDDDQYWIEYRIPVTAFTDEFGEQQLCYDTNFRLFFSTSASLTNPLQKDWMGEYIFGAPANITVIKIVEETVAIPGDTLHYRIFYNNTGDFNASNVWINDTIPQNTTYLESSPAYHSEDNGTYRWHFTDVAPGNHTIYLNVTVNLDVQDGTVLENVVVLNYTDDDDNEVPGSNDTTETTVETPIMTIMKEADPTVADPGDTVYYRIYYENTGSGDAYNVYINDTLPDHTSYVNSTPDCGWWTGDTCTWYFATIPGYSDGYIHLYVELDDYIADETVLSNYVVLEYYDENGNEYDPQDDWANITVQAPEMELSKTSTQTTANPGEEVTYTITYENAGTGDATDVVIVDTIDPDMTYVSATPSPFSVVSGVVTWNIGNVSAGASDSITLVVEVNAGVGDGDILVNHVTLNYDDANGNPQDELSDYWNVTCTAPVLTVTKIADKAEANPGDYIMYTITYSNTGSGDAGNVVITDTIDPHTNYVNATPSPTNISGDVLTWELGTVEGGTSGNIYLNVSVDAYVADGTVMTNTVVLSYEDPNGNEYEDETDEVNVTVTAPDMEVIKIADMDEANPGDFVTYTITYKNKGNGTATGVVIVDTIDPDTTYISAVPKPDNISGDVLTWYIGDVAGGTSHNITIIVQVDTYIDDGTVLTNWVTLNYNDTNDNPYDEEDDHVNVTTTAPFMEINKSANTGLANPGDIIIYTINYWNNGTGNATGVVITDTIDPDTTYVNATPPPTKVEGDLLTWNIGVVEGGGSGSIILRVRVDAYVDDGEIMTNTVYLNYNDTNDNPYTEESDYVNVTCTAPDVRITKSADKPSANPGDTIAYTIEYENKGTGMATDVVIVDTIDPDTTYLNATPTPSNVSGDIITWFIGNLTGGASGSITLYVKVDAYVDDGEVLTNKVTLNYDDTNGNPYPEVYDFVNVTCTAPSMDRQRQCDQCCYCRHDRPGHDLRERNTCSY
jgi:uncharacterized repeat protein (TIGR01451 family)